MLLSVALTGCAKNQTDGTGSGSSSAADVEKKTSGEITVYTALEDEQVTAYLAVFSAKYPDIKVNIVRDSTGVVTAKLLAEADNIQADVVWGTAASSLLVLEDKNLLAPYAPEGVGRVLSQFKSDKAVPTWVGIDVWETAFVINTDECARLGIDVPTSYDDLLKPEYAGLIVMSNPSSSGTGYLTVNGILQLMGTDAGWE
jgi:iron(III) transport system substrate-binding protein